MNKIDRYIQAATRDNTRRSYQSAIEHYEVTWGGFLPATADSIARYLADYADTLTVNTLKARYFGVSIAGAAWRTSHLTQTVSSPCYGRCSKRPAPVINSSVACCERRTCCLSS